MPEPISGNIALQVQTPNAMTTLGNMLNVGNMAQGLQRGRIEMQRAGTELQQQRMDLEERQNLRALGANINQFKTPDGGFDFDGLAAAATRAAPKLGLDWAKGVSGTIIEGNHAKQAINATDEQTRKQAGGILLGIADSPPEVQTSVINAAVNQYPQLTSAFRFLTNRVLPKATTPEARNAAIISAAKMVMSPEEQKSLGTPSGPVMSTGTMQGMVNTQPFLPRGPVQGTVFPANLVAPGAQEQQTTDALGRPVIQKKTPEGNITYAPPPGSTYKPLMTFPPGETRETAAPLFALRDQAQRVAAAAPQAHFENAQILRLAPQAFTGQGASKLAELLNSVGAQKLIGPVTASNATAQMQHWLALRTVESAQAAGANTDQARQMAANAVLPGASPEEAIKAITKVNDAYVTGGELFNKGAVAAINHPKNESDIFALRKFQNDWSANFDPNVMRFLNAQGDKNEWNALAKELGPAKLKALAQKYRNIMSLVNTGRLP